MMPSQVLEKKMGNELSYLNTEDIVLRGNYSVYSAYLQRNHFVSFNTRAEEIVTEVVNKALFILKIGENYWHQT